MNQKLEVDTGSGFKTVKLASRIKVQVDDQTLLNFAVPEAPQSWKHLGEILHHVSKFLRGPVVSYQFM